MKRVTLIGSGALDIILISRENKIELGTKIEIDDFSFFLGGGALNAAVTLRKLGLNPEIYFHVGDDFLGEIIESKVKRLKIKHRIFRHRKGTTFSIIFLPKGGERLILVFRGPKSNFSLRELNGIKLSSYLYISPGATSPPDLIKFLENVRSQIKLIAINPSKIFLQHKNTWRALSLTDIIFMNEEEARFLTKNNKTEIIDLGKEIYKKTRSRVLIITRGNKGSIAFFENNIYLAGVFRVNKVIDKTGAGDAFNSAFFGCMILEEKINKETVKKALIWGSANSSSVIQKLGAQNGILKKDDYLSFSRLKIKTLS